MNVNGAAMRTIWLEAGSASIGIIDQTLLPHQLVKRRLASVAEVAIAIQTMQVRGAPLIGVTAAYGMALAMRVDASDASLDQAAASLIKTRPTAVNLQWAVERMVRFLQPIPLDKRAAAAFAEAGIMAEEDVALNLAIGRHGLPLIKAIAGQRSRSAPVHILTHCNAGWLATVDHGTALSPIYQAHEAGIALHVWVDETRPRNQGAALTAWELGAAGVPHTLIVDNAGGHLMQAGKVDLVIVGADRAAANGDIANKIGTYLKALAAFDHKVPFYVCLPSSTIDWQMPSGAEIPIETRDPAEVKLVSGVNAAGIFTEVRIAPEATAAFNPAFDVTPARLITGLITERGICSASRAGLATLFDQSDAKVA